MYTRNVYSCVEKGCITNLEKLTRQCPKLLWVMVVFYGCLMESQGVSVWWKETAQRRVSMLSPFLLLNYFKPQSSKP